MKKFISISVIIVLLLGVSFTCNKCTPIPLTIKKEIVYQENIGDAENYYANYCASCHGIQAKEFLNRESWVYGSSRGEMFDVVKHGAEEDGMPMYGEVLTDQQVYELVDYILAVIEDKKSEEFNSGNHDDVVFVSEGMRFKLELVAENADSPWAITQSNDGRLFYTDKSGKLFAKQGDVIQEITGLPSVKYKGQGGMMDVILHPNFDNNQRIYLSYSKPKPDDFEYATTAVFSGILENNTLIHGKDIFVAEPYLNTNHHYGCRMIFDKNGFLFVAIGERGRRDENPQYLGNDLGKIHRLNDDGTVPIDNPFYNTPHAKKSIYSYGHRNPQGLCYNAVTNKIYVNEHGPRGGDEVNLVKAGENYGWPVITYGINYIGTKITDLTHQEGMAQPIRYWVPSIATCGMEIVTSDKYPAWKGNILSGSLKYNYLHRDVFDEHDVLIKEEKLFPDIGRMRSIEQCVDGYIYFGVEEPGKIYRIVPV